MRLAGIIWGVCMAAIGIAAAEKSFGVLNIRNQRIAVSVSAERSWNLSGLQRLDGPNLIREVKLLEFLRPDASEIPSAVETHTVGTENGNPVITVKRRSPYFQVIQKISLSSENDDVTIAQEIRILKTVQIGVLRMPVVRSSIDGDTLLFPENGTVVQADSAGAVNNLNPGYDDWVGVLERSGSNGFCLVVPENRQRSRGIFFFGSRRPGFYSFYYELRSGAFRDMATVHPGDILKFSFQLALFQGNVEKFLMKTYPGMIIPAPERRGPDRAVQVFWDPALYRDDQRIELLGGYPNAATLLFYLRKNGKPVDASKMSIQLDLPAAVSLRRAVLFQYWIPQRFDQNPIGETVTVEGQEFRRYRLALPPVISSWGDKGLFNSLKQHQLILYLETGKVGVPAEYPVRWQLNGPDGPGTVQAGKLQVLPFVPPGRLPKRFQLWGGIQRQLNWATSEEVEQYEKLYWSIGLTTLQRVEDPLYMKVTVPGLNARLRQNGFKLHLGYSPLRRIAEKNLKNPLPGSVWTRFNGQVGYQGNNPQHSFCPTWLVREDTPVYRECLNYFGTLKEVDYLWNDWEGKMFEGCYCPMCRKAYAEFVGIEPDRAAALPPKELVMLKPFDWIRFRNWQSGNMFLLFKTMMRTQIDSSVKSGGDFCLVDEGSEYPGLGMGFDRFCDDPRLMPNSGWDFALTDSLMSGLSSYDFIANTVSRSNLQLICKSGSIGGLGFYAGSWVSRRLMAEFQRRPLGLDFWPRLNRVMMVAYAANRAAGVLLEGSPMDGRFFIEAGKGAEQIARVEDFYLDGKPEPAVKAFDFSRRETSRKAEQGIGSSWLYYGRCWQQLWRYTCHRLAERTLITLFNFDMVQPRTVLFRLPEAGKNVWVVDPQTGCGMLSPSGREAWTSAELKTGIPLTAGSVEVAFAVVVPAGTEKQPEKWIQPKFDRHASPMPYQLPAVKKQDWRQVVENELERL